LQIFSKISGTSSWSYECGDTVSDTNTDEVYASDSSSGYAVTAPAVIDFKGEGRHTVQDSANGWNQTFNTNDSF